MSGETLWHKNAIIYELHVRAFADSNGDGIGDFRGLASRLDYLQDLGVTALWLLPFYPSPLRDDGYDISGYTAIHPMYGTLEDFQVFLDEAHRRGLKVITELVLNHTSDQHPWFQRARRAPAGSPERDFYVWSETSDRYPDTRIIFKDFESSNWAWDPVAKMYYWHRFYAHQPDLNYASPDVRRSMLEVVDFWMKRGVDGMRLDAVPYLYEREGTNGENLPETHDFLRELRSHIDRNFSGRVLLAEANQWPEEAAAYFGAGDECHLAFHFPIMPRMFMAIHMEDRFPLVDILKQTPAIPGNCQWALFLRNHDELTLEMVTDEERDYMYRVYANDPQARINLGIRRRLAPLLGGNRRKIELMNALLFSLPGTPVIYNGDEIGMGDNIYLGDRNGVRTPMQWSADKNAGFSRANPQRLYLPVIIDPEYHYEAVNVEAQQNNPQSLLWWMKRMIALNRRFGSFGRGSIRFLSPDNRKILAFLRQHDGETVLVVANLSRFVQGAELDLSEFQGCVPVELFGRQELPEVKERPYFLTLGPHGFYWFVLRPAAEAARIGAAGEPPALEADGPEWTSVLERRPRRFLEDALCAFLPSCRWFGGKGRRIKSAAVQDCIQVTAEAGGPRMLLVRVEYTEGLGETYLVPLAFSGGEAAERILRDAPRTVVARLGIRDGARGILHDPAGDRSFCLALLDAIGASRRLRGESGDLVPTLTSAFGRRRGEGELEPVLLRGEQSNSSIVFGGRIVLKLYRRLHEGINPDIEIGRFLTEKVAYSHTPDVAGYVEYQRPGAAGVSVAVLQQFVVNQGDAWKFTLDQLGLYFERVRAAHPEMTEVPVPRAGILDLTQEKPPALVQEAVGAYLESARLLGQRTAEMHVALASGHDDPNFSPEPFQALYQRSLYQSMRALTTQVFELLRRRAGTLDPSLRDRARRLAGLEEEVLQRFNAIVNRPITAFRIRVHGDYHLGQVLHTGADFVIIDFEGEPARSLSERRIKRSPLRDVAGMLRSFHYAASTALREERARAVVAPERGPVLEAWSRLWQVWSGSSFLRAYLDAASKAAFLPVDRGELGLLLTIYRLEKAVYELGYELNNRPDWAGIPIDAILEILEPAK